MGHDQASHRPPHRAIVSSVAPRLRTFYQPALDEAIPDNLMALVSKLDERTASAEQDERTDVMPVEADLVNA